MTMQLSLSAPLQIPVGQHNCVKHPDKWATWLIPTGDVYIPQCEKCHEGKK